MPNIYVQQTVQRKAFSLASLYCSQIEGGRNVGFLMKFVLLQNCRIRNWLTEYCHCCKEQEHLLGTNKKCQKKTAKKKRQRKITKKLTQHNTNEIKKNQHLGTFFLDPKAPLKKPLCSFLSSNSSSLELEISDSSWIAFTGSNELRDIIVNILKPGMNSLSKGQSFRYVYPCEKTVLLPFYGSAQSKENYPLQCVVRYVSLKKRFSPSTFNISET